MFSCMAVVIGIEASVCPFWGGAHSSWPPSLSSVSSAGFDHVIILGSPATCPAPDLEFVISPRSSGLFLMLGM